MSSVARHLLFDACCLMRVVGCLLMSVVWYVAFNVCCLLLVVAWSVWLAVCCLLLVVFCLLFGVCCELFVA